MTPTKLSRALAQFAAVPSEEDRKLSVSADRMLDELVRAAGACACWPTVEEPEDLERWDGQS